MEMVEKIAKALDIEPFKLFVDDDNRVNKDIQIPDNYLEALTTVERQDLTKRILTIITNDLEQILQPESK